MEEMGIKNLTETINFDLDIKLYSRELFINKFIEKFPRANLHTLIQINKYYDKKNTINKDKNFSVITIYDYLSELD